MFFPGGGKEFCPLLFQKALEMIDKSASIYLGNVRWILVTGHLTFEGVMSDLRKKKYPADWCRGGESLQGYAWDN